MSTILFSGGVLKDQYLKKGKKCTAKATTDYIIRFKGTHDHA